MPSLSDLMDDAKPAPKLPRREVNDHAATDAVTPAAAGGDNKKLARQLREFSRKVRGDLVAELAKKNPDLVRVEGLFPTLTGYVHRGTVEEFWPVVDGLWKLGSANILRGAVVMGGWHRPLPPSLDGAASLPPVLEQVLGSLDLCQKALAIVQTAPGPQWKEHLVSNKWLFPFADTLDPCQAEAAGEKVKGVRRDLNRKAEHVLCTMQNQALVFYPTPGDPRRGWADFHFILSWYRLLDASVQRDFGPYHFLFLPPD